MLELWLFNRKSEECINIHAMVNWIKFIFMYYSDTRARWLLYLSIAFLMSIHTSLDKYTSLGEIPPLKLGLIFTYATLQALLAWRAFIDQSLSRPPNGSSGIPPLSGS